MKPMGLTESGSSMPRKVKPGVNDLGTVNPDLAEQLVDPSSRKTQFWYIFGAGDAVQRLIIPGLDRIGVSQAQRRILAPEGSSRNLTSGEKVEKLHSAGSKSGSQAQSASTYIKEHSGIYVIASPTETHVDYLRKLHAFGRRGVCEKPLTLDRREFDFLQGNIEVFDQVFVLGYYSLDKGIPLSYLYDPRVVYEPYLRIESDSDVSTNRVLNRLGKLEAVNFLFEEPVTLDPSELSTITVRNLEDLVFHPFTLLAQILGVGVGKDWMIRLNDESKCVFDEVGSLAMNFEFVETKTMNSVRAEIVVRRSGGVLHRDRNMTVTYSNGTVEANFDSKSCSVFDEAKQTLWKAQLLPQFQQNYSSQFSLVHSWVSKGCSPRTYDVLPEQMWATDVWISIRERYLSDQPKSRMLRGDCR